jgi:hypothetical protein
MSCRWCGGDGPEDECPRGIRCPTCGANPGAWCKRPSGHRAMTMHKARFDAVGYVRPSPLKEGGGGEDAPSLF